METTACLVSYDGVADETLTGYGVNFSAENVLGEQERKSSSLMESNQR